LASQTFAVEGLAGGTGGGAFVAGAANAATALAKRKRLAKRRLGFMAKTIGER
jgi:hypothetical protein